MCLAQSDWAVEYTDYIPAKNKTPRQTSVLDMILNNMMVTLK